MASQASVIKKKSNQLVQHNRHVLTPNSSQNLRPHARLCIGRDKVVTDVVSELLGGLPRPLAILGPPGIGKSTISLVALHDAEVVGRYRERRYFVRCEAARTSEALLAEVARVVGVELGQNLMQRLFAELNRAPTVLVLDNLETPWEMDTTATESVVTDLSAIDGLALIVSIRGGERPLGPPWRESIRLERLTEKDALTLFSAIAEMFSQDPILPDLIRQLDGVPLAVELMAYIAQAEPDLKGIKRRWERKRTEILKRAGARERVTNIEISFELSITSPRMTEEAQQLLFIMGLLPDGMWWHDLETMMPGTGEDAVSTLRKVGLAFDEADRVRLLAPLREYIKRAHKPKIEFIECAARHYLSLAEELGPKVGETGGARAIERLASDIANIEEMISYGLGKTDPLSAVDRALNLVDFQRFSGYGTPQILQQAREVARSLQRSAHEAYCIQGLADISLARFKYDGAQAYYEEALAIYRSIGSVLGEANCIYGLGDIALFRTNLELAQQHYDKALPLYQRANDAIGMANCLMKQGDISSRNLNYAQARKLFEQALPTYRSIGSVLGEANCIYGLGNIALSQTELGLAQNRFEEALQLFQSVGDLVGEANCNIKLGDIALAHSNDGKSQQYYKQAMSIYQRVGMTAIDLQRQQTESQITERFPNEYHIVVTTYRQPRVSANKVLLVGQKGTLDKVREQEAFSLINIPAAIKEVDTYAPVKIAILATGISSSVVEISPHVIAGRNVVFGEDPSDYADVDGSGTAMAAIIAAISPGAEILAFKVFGEDGAATFDILKAIDYAVDDGARIILMPFGTPTPQVSIRHRIEDARDRNMVLISTAGIEDSGEPIYPAAFPGVISVAVTDKQGKLTPFSNLASWVTLFAPGIDILSIDQEGLLSVTTGGDNACAVVAGVASLILSARPNLKADEVEQILSRSATVLKVARENQKAPMLFRLVDALNAIGNAKALKRINGN